VTVDKDLASANSGFFKAGASDKRKEGKEATIRMPTTEIKTFRLLTHWLYRGSGSSKPSNSCVTRPAALRPRKLK
jgi:hypothetical protein